MKRFNQVLISFILIACTMGLMQTHAATFTISDGDINGLKAAINTANSNKQPDTINLAAFGTYTLTTIEDYFEGDLGLPIVDVDGSALNILTINGNGATLIRDAAAPEFRLLYCIGNTNINYLHFANGKLSSGGRKGGALVVNSGTYILTGCTFFNNLSDSAGGALNVNSDSHVTISNCTFTNNSSGTGSAIYNFVGLKLYIYNTTISGNSTTTTTGETVANGDATKLIYIRSSIIANNTLGSLGKEVGDGVVLQGGSLIGSSNSTFITTGNPSASGDYVTTSAAPLDAKLSTLADNGGFTKTMALQSTSPAINKGAVGDIVATDQRGYSRVGQLDAGAYEYNATLPAPVIATSGLDIPSGFIGTVLTISGINMSAVTQIKFQGSAAVTTGFTNNTATSVTVTVPAGTTTGKITVTTAKGTSALSAQSFVVGTPPPVIASTGLSVTSGSVGTLLTITGTNFSSITQIKFQGTAAVTTGFTNNTATSVTVVVPVGAASGKITVTTAGGTSALSTQSFTINTPLPVIASTGLSVTTGPIGTLLTITGTNLAGITEIKFQGAAAVTTGFTNNTATAVTVAVPAGTTTGKITVTTAGGTSALSTQDFVIILPPAIGSTGLSATHGLPGSSLTITGTEFSNITAIKFEGAAPVTTGFTDNTATSVTVVVPVTALTGQITVTTAGGTSAPSDQTFTIDILPASVNAAVFADVKIFPNPATDYCTIQINKNNLNISANIYSSTGQRIKEITLIELNTDIDMQELDSGVYIVVIRNAAGESMNYRLVKN